MIALKQEGNHIHNVSMMNDFPLNEHNQLIQATKPDASAPPTAGLEEAARQTARAEEIIIEAGIQGMMEHHAKYMKAHRIAMEYNMDLAAQAKSGTVERIVERIIEMPQDPGPPSSSGCACSVSGSFRNHWSFCAKPRLEDGQYEWR
ncbi:hypothetical protein N9L68_02970 [bacterium]|nr:hypothetical protein [bacterium]